jgi:uncharacterized protein with GYD domain
MKVTFTNQAMTTFVENPQDRFQQIRPMFEAVGAKLLEYWFAVDQCAVYLLAEAPASEDGPVNALTLQMLVVGGGIAASVETTRVVSATEGVEAMKKAKSLVPRPPAGTKAAKK